MAIVEYEPGAAFPGVIGRTADESTPAWPAPVRAREGAPNVLFIVLDDTGFACTWPANDDPTVPLNGLPLHNLPRP